MNAPAGAFQLDGELARFAESGLAITVCGRDADLVPSVGKALACRVWPDRRRITVFAMRPRMRDVLRDIDANGTVAVALSLPTSHRTVQFKCRVLDVAPMQPADEPHVQAGIAALRADLARFGFPMESSAAYLHYVRDDTVAVTLAVEEAYEQTPGPNAGTRLR